jgi:hypothetical protein
MRESKAMRRDADEKEDDTHDQKGQESSRRNTSNFNRAASVEYELKVEIWKRPGHVQPPSAGALRFTPPVCWVGAGAPREVLAAVAEPRDTDANVSVLNECTRAQCGANVHKGEYIVILPGEKPLLRFSG